MVVVSPHLDDAVFACGDLLASRPSSWVLTVFAGRPPSSGNLTGWDADAGFHHGEDVVGLRRAEDAAALRILGAKPLWLDFLDAQYGPSPPASSVATELESAIRKCEADEVYGPLGLFHSDHRLTTRACLQTMEKLPELRWFAYADALYRQIPGLLRRRLAALKRLGIVARPIPVDRLTASQLKRRAVEAYPSQLRALAIGGRSGHEDAFAPEQVWSLKCR
jgi:LmbE family N-acetylglucosaminyl deacetylase